MSRYQLYTGDVVLKGRSKVACFPGTFDLFTLSHKEIARRIRELGYTVFLAIDEFSWSKKTQPHLVRRQIVNMSMADEFYVHLFPDDIPINIANPADLKRLREIFAEQEVYIVAGSDAVHNASSDTEKGAGGNLYRWLQSSDLPAGPGDARPGEIYECITGKVEGAGAAQEPGGHQLHQDPGKYRQAEGYPPA